MIYQLSKENIALAKEEVLALVGKRECKLIDNFLIVDGECDYTRLAYTNNVFEEIFISDKIEDVDWEKYYEGSFAARSNITAQEPIVAKQIWDNVKDPKVDLKNPKSEFHFIFIKDTIICGKKIYKRQEKFNLRRPDLRPGFFPISLKPKLARALVNVSGIKEGVVWDPFCGTGGILLEAALMSLQVIGTDLDKEMIEAAKKNFEKYNLTGDFHVADARKEQIKCDVIITDPPYGRRASLKKTTIEKLYTEFLDNVYPFVNTVVIMSPNTLNIKSKYKVSFQADEYIHSTLTRRVTILQR